MPTETQNAVDWALDQYIEDEYEKHYVKDENGSINNQLLVDFVRKYFNENQIECPPMNYYDLEPYL